MELLNELNDLLRKINSGQDTNEPYYFKLCSPVSDKEGWYGGIFWAHHDGDITIKEYTSDKLSFVLLDLRDTLRAEINMPSPDLAQ